MASLTKGRDYTDEKASEPMVYAREQRTASKVHKRERHGGEGGEVKKHFFLNGSVNGLTVLKGL